MKVYYNGFIIEQCTPKELHDFLELQGEKTAYSYTHSPPPPIKPYWIHTPVITCNGNVSAEELIEKWTAALHKHKNHLQ